MLQRIKKKEYEISEGEDISKTRRWGEGEIEEGFPKKSELTRVFKNRQDLNMQKQPSVEGTPSMEKGQGVYEEECERQGGYRNWGKNRIHWERS